MKTVSTIVAIAVSAICVPVLANTARPLVTVMDAKQISATCDAALKRASATVKKLEAKKGDNGFLKSWNDLQIDLENTGNPLYLLANVHTDKATRDAGDACVLKLTSFGTDLFQNEKLYKRVAAVVPKNAIDAKLKKDLSESFEDTGVTLPLDKRARAKAIFEKLEELRQSFDRNVRDDKTKLTFSAEELKGLPADYLSSRKLDEKGGLTLTLEYPDYNPFIQSATNEAARERYFRAFLSRGGMPNLSLLDEIATLRRELAALYGFKSYAERWWRTRQP
jgi:thimet oligopeptidase